MDSTCLLAAHPPRPGQQPEPRLGCVRRVKFQRRRVRAPRALLNGRTANSEQAAGASEKNASNAECLAARLRPAPLGATFLASERARVTCSLFSSDPLTARRPSASGRRSRCRFHTFHGKGRAGPAGPSLSSARARRCTCCAARKRHANCAAPPARRLIKTARREAALQLRPVAGLRGAARWGGRRNSCVLF